LEIIHHVGYFIENISTAASSLHNWLNLC